MMSLIVELFLCNFEVIKINEPHIKRCWHYSLFLFQFTNSCYILQLNIMHNNCLTYNEIQQMTQTRKY